MPGIKSVVENGVDRIYERGRKKDIVVAWSMLVCVLEDQALKRVRPMGKF